MSEWYELLDVRIILIAGETYIYIYLILFLIILSFDMYINCVSVFFLQRIIGRVSVDSPDQARRLIPNC